MSTYIRSSMYFSEMGGKRNFKRTLCLVLALLTIDTEGSIRPSVSASLQKIKTSMTSAGKNVDSRVDEISNYLDSDGGSSAAETLSTSIEDVARAITSLTSDDPVQIVSGTLDMITAVSPLMPVGGQIISTVFTLVGSILVL